MSTKRRTPRWEHLGFPSQQHYAARVGVNKRRIAIINARLSEISWFSGTENEESSRLNREKDRLVDQIAPLPPLPSVRCMRAWDGPGPCGKGGPRKCPMNPDHACGCCDAHACSTDGYWGLSESRGGQA